jgi:hypothetical protein
MAERNRAIYQQIGHQPQDRRRAAKRDRDT